MKKYLMAVVALAAMVLSFASVGLVSASVAVAAPVVTCASADHPAQWDRPGGYCEQAANLKSLASQPGQPSKCVERDEHGNCLCDHEDEIPL